MKLFQQLVKSVKDILFIPKNIANKSSQSVKLSELENKFDALNQKLNDLNFDLILQKIDAISQNSSICSNIKMKESINIESSELVSKMQEGYENHFLQIESLISIYNSLPNLKYLPSTRGWAGSPDFLNKIIEVIFKQKPGFVLEASSGVSSIVIGLALKMNNYGKAFSLEHDTSYSEITRKNLEVNDIGDIFTINNCPLTDCLIDGEIWKWYETDGLTITEKIDLLIIDGPPRTTQKLARYPAIPILYKYFSDNVIILLDDAKRPDEIVIMKKWIDFLEKKGCKIIVERNLNYEKGLVLLVVKKEL